MVKNNSHPDKEGYFYNLLNRVLLSTIIILALMLNFSVLNAQIMDKRSIVAEGASLELLGNGFEFTEGPAPAENGDVYFTDQPNNDIVKWDASTGEVSVFMDNAGRSNGMFFSEEGNLITCADMKNQLWSINMDTKEVKVLVEDYNDKRLNGPNDLWIHPNGGIYFTDPLYKRDYWKRDPEMQQDGEHVYYLGPDRERLIRVEEGLVKPNGIVGTPDGEKLYVTDIGDKKTYVYNINEDGSLSSRKLYVEMGSDGMTIDNRGNVYLTGDGVTVFDKKGEKIAHIPVDKGWTANVCFGGPDRKMLFITAMDSVFGLKMNVKGTY
jgi:gluconolactonase